jgi:purine-binding chemotaxis protein CheW
VIEGVCERGAVSAEWLNLREIIAPVFRPREQREGRAVAARAEARPQNAEREASFLAFLLAGQRFAFPITEVRAVIRAPVELVAVPEATPVVLGLTPYREGVASVVDLARLLGLPSQETSPLTRLVVVEIGGAAVGLRVERALGALRVSSRAISSVPALLNRGAGEARVSAIARSASGLTAILAVNRLFDEETTRRLEALAVAEPAPERAAAEGGEPVLVFRVGAERFGLPAASVEAVTKSPTVVSRAPNAPAFLAGAIPHRGQAIPLIDARLRFGADCAAGGVVVVVRRDALAAGLWVDAAERLVRLPRSRIEPAPPLFGDAGALFVSVSVLEHEGRPLLVVDPDALLAQAQRDLSSGNAASPRRGRA